jgi:phosphatidate cytidylyltransferase
MGPRDEERGSKFDDLFEDLDRFFAQNNPGSPRPAGEAPDDDPEHSEELLPPGWEPDIEGIDLPGERDSRTEPLAAGSRPPDDPESDDEDPLREGHAREGGMSGQSTWDDRDGIDVGPDEADEPAAEEDLHELNLQDLKKAPPEYRDLPRAEDAGELEEESAPIGEPEIPGEDELAEPEDQAWEGSPEEEPAAADEPEFADVEAAADNLAASFEARRGPGQVEEELLADIEEPAGPRTVRVGGAETLTGPTWEEPTSHPVLTEPGGPPEPGRNLPAAVLTAAGLAAVALLTLAWAKAAFAVVAGAVVLLGQAELFATMHRKGHQPATALGLVVGGFTLAGAYLKGEQAMAFFVALGLMLSFLWYMAAVPKAREGALAHIGATMLGVLYVPFLAGYVLLILTQARSGRALMLAVLGLTFIYDIAAFLVGSVWGSRALAPSISPKKSWEGLVGATALTFLLSVAFLPMIDPLNLVKSVGLFVVVAVFAPLGDLAESAIKRDLGVKDMGSVLPGHGGILDRIDSVLFVAPAAFYFLRLIF